MRAAVLQDGGRLVVEEVPRPEPAPDEILLRGGAGRENPAERLRAVAGRDPEVVFDVGVRGMLGEALGYADTRGVVVVLGACLDADEIYPPAGGAQGVARGYSKAEFADTLAALAARRVDGEALVTDVVGIDDAPRAFEALMRPATQCKVLIEFP